jgi:hypothetical protein
MMLVSKPDKKNETMRCILAAAALGTQACPATVEPIQHPLIGGAPLRG